MFAGIILIAFLLILTWFLTAPLQLRCDSDRGELALRWRGLGSSRLLLAEADLLIEIQILFLRKSWSLLARSTTKKQKKTKKKRKFKPTLAPKKIKRLLGALQIKELQLDLDTDDYLINSYLFPVFHYFQSKGKHLRINYQGRCYFRLIIETRGYRILRALIA